MRQPTTLPAPAVDEEQRMESLHIITTANHITTDVTPIETRKRMAYRSPVSACHSTHICPVAPALGGISDAVGADRRHRERGYQRALRRAVRTRCQPHQPQSLYSRATQTVALYHARRVSAAGGIYR
mgnify:CR=1 FL=1